MIITQIARPTRPKKKIESVARMVCFLPVNAYVRNIRMPENMADTSVNSAHRGGGPSCAYIVRPPSITKA